MTRSKPAALHAAIASRSAAEISLPAVARGERAHVDAGPWIAFMRMRSPSSAPPVLRRDGSIDDDRDAQAVALVEPEAPHQLVGERALARAAGAR